MRPVVAIAVGVLLGPSTPAPARAETAGDRTVAAIDLSGRGGPASSESAPARGGNGAFEFSAQAGFATDYIYRGTTLSDHKPVVGASFEAAFAQFYAGATLASVKLPSDPAAEITFGGGIRPKLGNLELDFGWTYFLYPGETPGTNTDYWEAAARGDIRLSDAARIAAGFAYSPNISQTGAWSKYAAAGLSIELPHGLLPYGIQASVTGGAGYFWFGNQAPSLGGFPLPAYLNWNAGIAFERGKLHLDLRYYDTNLSKEDCFVFTGDPNAMPGGRVDPVTNPGGLVSRWCSATFVAKLSFALN